LNADQYLSLSLKASVYLTCWQLAHALEDIAECPAALEEPCVNALTDFEVLDTPEIAEGNGEAGEGGEDGEAAAEEEPAEDAEGAEGEAGCGEEVCEVNEEGEEVCTGGDGEDGDDAEDQVKVVPAVTDLQVYPTLNAMQASCFYWAVTANTPAKEDEMTRDDALLPENHD